jgi:hypothetical protein
MRHHAYRVPKAAIALASQRSAPRTFLKNGRLAENL